MTLVEAGAPQRRELDQVRAAIARVQADLESVAAASFTVDESLERILRLIEDKRRLAEVQLSYFTRPGDGPTLPDFSIGFLAALFGPREIEARLRDRFEELIGEPGLPRLQRDRQLGELRTKLTELEEREEAEICALEASGYIVDRRAVDPELILRVWDRLTLKPGD